MSKHLPDWVKEVHILFLIMTALVTIPIIGVSVIQRPSAPNPLDFERKDFQILTTNCREEVIEQLPWKNETGKVLVVTGFRMVVNDALYLTICDKVSS